MKTIQTHGHARRDQVPALPGTTVKLCPRCKKWFAARPRERVCDGCRRPSQAAEVEAKPRETKPVAYVPQRIIVEHGRFPYTHDERLRSVSLALRLASKAKEEEVSYTDLLVIYARSVARGVVPGRIWQLARLGRTIAPCNGERNPTLMPHPDQPETLAEASESERP